MLEQMRQKGSSIFIYLIFGVLIAVFVINFGPSGGNAGGGCGTSGNSVMEVDGSNANLSAYRVAYSNPYNPGRSRERVYFALETLIRRELLADAANERGLRVTGDMVDEEIKKGYFFVGGLRIPLGGNIFDEHEDGTRTWNVLKFKRWVANLDVKSTSTYRDEQIRSMQAALMHELLTSSARVSREEALNDFLYTKNTVSYDVVTFSPASYRAQMRLADSDIEHYLAAHDAEVKARFQQDERLYKGLKPQLKLRQIKIEIAKVEAPKPTEPIDPGSGSAAGSAAGSGAGSGSGSSADAPKPDAPKADAPKADAPKADAPKPDVAKPAGLTAEAAKAKLEAARAAIASSKQKFADAAKQLNTDVGMQASGGDVGWRGVENAQLGDKAVNDAVKELEPGEMTPVIVTDNGAYLVMAEAKREGDLTYDQVKLEIAGELARDGYAQEAAKRAALKALDEARAGTGKSLGDMFEKEPDQGGGMPNLDFLNDPNMSEEQKQMILEQLKQQMQQQQGSIEIESKDVPASWKAPDETKGNGGSSAGGSANTGSAGSAGSAAEPPPEVPPTPGKLAEIAPVAATTDQLPAFGDVPKPKLAHFGPEPRKSPLPALSKELTTVVFDELSAGMLAKRVYEVDGSFVLLQVTNKGQAAVADFDKEADRYISRLQTVRSYTFVEDWLDARCKALAKDKKIIPMKDLVRESDDKGNAAPQVYQPCMYGPQWLTAMLQHLR